MRAQYLFMLVVLGLCGCAAGSAEQVAAPREEIKVYYYVGAEGISLKSSPDSNSAAAGPLRLNEQVEKLKLGPAGWFLVSTQDGRQGWINEKYLQVSPVSEFFVRRWGVRLRTEPQENGKTLARLKTNDRVKLLEKNPQGWAKITVASTQETGWLKTEDLSVAPVVIRRVRRRPAKPAPQPAAGKTADTLKGEAPPTHIMTPTPAEAASPPVKQPLPKPKARPEMFEPF